MIEPMRRVDEGRNQENSGFLVPNRIQKEAIHRICIIANVWSPEK